MKIKAILAAFAMVCAGLFGAHNASAQSSMKKGDIALNVDYSIGSFSKDYSGVSQHAIGFMGEYAFLGDVINSKGCVSAGVQLGFGFGNDDQDVPYITTFKRVDVDCFRFRLATRGTLHYAFIPQLDTYAGLTFLFVDVDKVKWNDPEGKKYTDKNADLIEPTLFAGARYMFTNNFGVNAEFSWDHFAYTAIGLSFKF